MSANSDLRVFKRVASSALVSSVPLIILVMNSYVDQFFITLGGSAAAAAYTLVLPIYWLLISSGTVIGGVLSTDIRGRLSRGDREGAEKLAFKAMVYSVLFGLLFTVIVAVFMSRSLLSLIPSSDVRRSAVEFMAPIIYLFFGISLNGVLCGIVNGTGHFRVYLAALVFSLVGNCIFDPYFVQVLGYGVFGNGLGTALSMLVSTGFLMCWVLAGKTGIRLSFSRGSGRSDRLALLPLFGASMYNVIITNLGELAIRYSLYLRYALTYGIPMLYSSIVSIIGTGLANSSVKQFFIFREKGDRESALKLLKQLTLAGFGLMMAISIVMCLLSVPLVDIFLSNPEMGENRKHLIITMQVLVFTAPFSGVKNICDSVFISKSRLRYYSLSYTIWQVFKVAVILLALSYSFHFAIFAILLERVSAAGVMTYFSRRFILRHYGGASPHGNQ